MQRLQEVDLHVVVQVILDVGDLPHALSALYQGLSCEREEVQCSSCSQKEPLLYREDVYCF